MKYKHCAIVAGGNFSSLTGIEKYEYIIACDKGLEYLSSCGIRPDLLVGDFDSFKGEIPSDIPCLSLPVEKDDTDTMAAIRHVTDTPGCAEIGLFCALGGRLDHLLGNIQAASYAAEKGLMVQIYSDESDLYFLNDRSVRIEPKEGYSLSLISLSDKCCGVSVSGTKYQLKDATLTNTFPIGVSNEWKESAEIEVKSGTLLVVLSKMTHER